VADIIRELAAAKLALVTRHGRRNQYVLNPDAHFRHPLVADIPFRTFLKAIEIAKGERNDDRTMRSDPS
jgi:hypothetical protein